MSIDIDIKEARRYGKRYENKPLHERADKYESSKGTYKESDLFELIIHKEIERKEGGTFLRFKSAILGIIWSSLFYSDTNRLDRIEVYFSNLNSKIPLILGVITDKSSRYYITGRLKSLGPDIAKRPSFKSDQLLDKLIEENNKKNKVITYRLEKTNTN